MGQPRVNYRETIQSRAEFDYLHKKQSGGQVHLLAAAASCCLHQEDQAGNAPHSESQPRSSAVGLYCCPTAETDSQHAECTVQTDHSQQPYSSLYAAVPQGQYGRVMGYIEPLDPEDVDQENPEKVLFANEVFGNAIPPSFLPACEKGFREACNAGSLINHPVEVWPRLRVVAVPGSAGSCSVMASSTSW